MKLRYLSFLTACLFIVACSPSIEEIKPILDSYIAGLGEVGPTLLMDVEKADKNIYSGTYSVSQADDIIYVYPFTAIIKGYEVLNFFKETDDTEVIVITVKPEALAYDDVSDFTEDDFVYETKKDYDERIRKEEEERQAAIAASRRASSGSDLAQKGANYLLSGQNNIIQIISYSKAAKTNTAIFQSMFGSGVIAYNYKVLKANSYGGTEVDTYTVVFQNGSIIYVDNNPGAAGIGSTLDAIISSPELLNGILSMPN